MARRREYETFLAFPGYSVLNSPMRFFTNFALCSGLCMASTAWLSFFSPFSLPTNKTCLQFFSPPRHMCLLLLRPQKPLGRKRWEHWPGEQSSNGGLGTHEGHVTGVWRDGRKKEMGRRREGEGVLKKLMNTNLAFDWKDQAPRSVEADSLRGRSDSWAAPSETMLFGYTVQKQRVWFLHRLDPVSHSWQATSASLRHHSFVLNEDSAATWAGMGAETFPDW